MEVWRRVSEYRNAPLQQRPRGKPVQAFTLGRHVAINTGGNMTDFCYSWPVFNRIFHQVELMDRMMGLVGVDPDVAGRVNKGAAWYEARTSCMSCCHERECRNWLECSEGLLVPPDFCPNAEFFRRCA